ncbi:uncharacterized protein LOC106172751 [Lingula anatina]|uniref:Uncharacterized protein LOC106172751 n=1 Tax=Lingula anatina TaxID=7574 RepID=A0A1S3JF51_LINAN|nr:uncharacterized protein LOC106172751 [Lingula anatina]|eukprot:XP_013409042.1 uncharacterized protein LOC106172751 [Lingula anatina]
MADINISVSIGVVVCVIVAELISTLWYNDRTPWHSWHGARFFAAALISDVGLVLIMSFLTKKYYSVSYRDWESAAWLAGLTAALYACLEAPHVVHNGHSLRNFTFHVFHKFVIVFAIVLVYDYCNQHF